MRSLFVYKKSLIFIMSILFVIMVLSGCSNQGENEKSEEVINPEVNEGEGLMDSLEKQEQNENDSKEQVAQFFDSNLTLMKEDGKVNLNFTMENISDSGIDLTFTSSKKYDFFVYNEKNEQVYQWSKGRSFAMVMKEVRIEPGDKVTFNESWDYVNQNGEKLPDGTYRVEFQFAANAKTSEGKTVDKNELKASASIENASE